MFRKVVVLVLLCQALSAFAGPNGARPGHVAASASGFVKTGLLMANGVFDPNKMIIFDPRYHEDVRHRTPARIAEHRALAIEHMETVFGINIEQLVAEQRIMFSPFFMNDDMAYRVYSLSDTWVPTRGFTMHDGGWILMVTDPNGIDLSDGKHIPAGSVSVYGEYYVEVRNEGGVSADPIIVHYQSDRFIVSGFYGETPILCDVFHPDWGWGRAQGVALPFPDVGGANANTRNVWTFTGSDFSRPSHAVWFE